MWRRTALLLAIAIVVVSLVAWRWPAPTDTIAETENRRPPVTASDAETTREMPASDRPADHSQHSSIDRPDDRQEPPEDYLELAAPPRDGAANGDVIGLFRVKVMLPDFRSARGAWVLSRLKQRRPPERGGDRVESSGTVSIGQALTNDDGKARVPIQYERRCDAEGVFVELQVSHAGYRTHFQWFEFEEIWGKIVPVTVVLDPGQTMEVVLEGVDPEDLDGKGIQFSASLEIDDGNDIAHFTDFYPRRCAFELRGLWEGEMHVNVRDTQGRYDYYNAYIDPPFPNRLVIPLIRRANLGLVVFPDWIDEFRINNYQEMKFFRIDTGEEVYPKGYIRRASGQVQRGPGYRFAPGEYAAFFFSSRGELPNGRFASTRFLVGAGEAIDAEVLPYRKYGVRVVLRVRSPGGEVRRVCFQMLARLPGTDRFVPLLKMWGDPGTARWGAEEEGMMVIGGAPTGGRLRIYGAREEGWQERSLDVTESEIVTLDLPTEPNATIDETITLSAGD